MWPKEPYNEDTEQHLHRGPQIASEEWLADSIKSRHPVDLQKNLAGAAEGSSDPVNAATKVAPWLQSQQGDSESPSLKRARDGSSPKPADGDMDVDKEVQEGILVASGPPAAAPAAVAQASTATPAVKAGKGAWRHHRRRRCR